MEEGRRDPDDVVAARGSALTLLGFERGGEETYVTPLGTE